jgi:hypothetical protein
MVFPYFFFLLEGNFVNAFRSESSLKWKFCERFPFRMDPLESTHSYGQSWGFINLTMVNNPNELKGSLKIIHPIFKNLPSWGLHKFDYWRI